MTERGKKHFSNSLSKRKLPYKTGDKGRILLLQELGGERDDQKTPFFKIKGGNWGYKARAFYMTCKQKEEKKENRMSNQV